MAAALTLISTAACPSCTTSQDIERHHLAVRYLGTSAPPSNGRTGNDAPFALTQTLLTAPASTGEGGRWVLETIDPKSRSTFALTVGEISNAAPVSQRITPSADGRGWFTLLAPDGSSGSVLWVRWGHQLRRLHWPAGGFATSLLHPVPPAADPSASSLAVVYDADWLPGRGLVALVRPKSSEDARKLLATDATGAVLRYVELSSVPDREHPSVRECVRCSELGCVAIGPTIGDRFSVHRFDVDLVERWRADGLLTGYRVFGVAPAADSRVWLWSRAGALDAPTRLDLYAHGVGVVRSWTLPPARELMWFHRLRVVDGGKVLWVAGSGLVSDWSSTQLRDRPQWVARIAADATEADVAVTSDWDLPVAVDARSGLLAVSSTTADIVVHDRQRAHIVRASLQPTDAAME